MPQPQFEVVPLGNQCYTINDNGRTVATISSQGFIDWLLHSPLQPGPLVTEIIKETHLCYTLGLKMQLNVLTPATNLTAFSYQLEEDNACVVLIGEGLSADGHFSSRTVATLAVNRTASGYYWQFATTISCVDGPATLHGIEYNNVYPRNTGCCMLYTPRKEYSCTLMTDSDGVIWRFPHQHMMHYSVKISQLEFATGTMAGFFGEPAPAGYPVVTVLDSDLPPDWAICDMYYDLHCMARISGTVQTGESWNFRYEIKYLDDVDASPLLLKSQPVRVTLDDWEIHDYPRLELGMNAFTRGVDIDRPDDASGFRQRPPQLVWDRAVGHRTRGALRITNTVAEETVWSAEPPTQIPPNTRLNITAKVKTDGVVGTGLFIRVRYHTFHWYPTPHIEWPLTLASPPVTGTTDGWVQVSVPELQVPSEEFDYLIWIDVILDGQGVAWLTDVDIDLQYDQLIPPSLEEGGQARKTTASALSRRLAGSGPVR